MRAKSAEKEKHILICIAVSPPTWPCLFSAAVARRNEFCQSERCSERRKSGDNLVFTPSRWRQFRAAYPSGVHLLLLLPPAEGSYQRRLLRGEQNRTNGMNRTNNEYGGDRDYDGDDRFCSFHEIQTLYLMKYYKTYVFLIDFCQSNP